MRVINNIIIINSTSKVYYLPVQGKYHTGESSRIPLDPDSFYAAAPASHRDDDATLINARSDVKGDTVTWGDF